MEPPVKNFKNLMIYTLHIPTTHTRTQSRFIDWNAPVCYSLLHFGPEMSHRSIKPPPHTHTHTQVLLGGPWGRGERALAPLSGKPDLLTSAASDGAAQWRDVCVCVWREKKRAGRGINIATEEEVRDRQTLTGDTGHLAVVMETY